MYIYMERDILLLQVESELAGFSNEERVAYLDQLGVTDDTCGLKVEPLSVVEISLS